MPLLSTLPPPPPHTQTVIISAQSAYCFFNPASTHTQPQGLQEEHDELEKAFRKEKKELEEKYAKLYGAWGCVHYLRGWGCGGVNLGGGGG
jgi:hypothetical protein